MKVIVNKKNVIKVENVEGRLNLTIVGLSSGHWCKCQERPLPNAGMFINAKGGVERVMAEAIDVKNLDSYLSVQHAAMVASREVDIIKAEAKANERRGQFLEVFGNGKVETNIDNLTILLRYLNSMPWGQWNLSEVSMTINGNFNQYAAGPANGRTITTVTLDEPIEVEGKMVRKFAIGACNGEMSNYYKLR